MNIAEYFRKSDKIFPFGTTFYSKSNEQYSFIHSKFAVSLTLGVHLLKFNKFIEKTEQLKDVNGGLTKKQSEFFLGDLSNYTLDECVTLEDYFTPILPFGTVIKNSHNGNKYILIQDTHDTAGLISTKIGKLLKRIDNYTDYGVLEEDFIRMGAPFEDYEIIGHVDDMEI